ncbi:TlpA family protein disulfide reductase [Sphingobacterium yanglingense]|uniref:Thiol-disulfide isomerase/thioredoxin n=1 Tax=Sphingobacterium yanglingense TaxID=1437280 RepID=A0A4R6W817_9SPHI|nr:hypothetical protein [Sphingobacterium yanglingense]TDQ73661.1 thiol-disulfide isomerase/thioredoxin [Sphingobacterium yanglingense]
MKRYLYILWLSATVFSTQIIRAQIAPLVIGDSLDLAIRVELTNSPKAKLRLEKFAAELMVLDFYNTYCGSCIAAFPKNNILQRKFGNRIRILPITYEDKKKVDGFNQKNDYMRGNELPIIIKDKTLSALLPHRGVPHLVWIWQGRIAAITSGDMLTEANVDHILSGQSVVDWPRKNDFFDYEMEESQQDTMLYSKFYSYQNGAKLNYLIDTIGNRIRAKFTNVHPLPLFTFLYGKKHPEMPFMKKKERVVLNVKDLTDFERDTTMPYSLWLQEHSFCYESTWPLGIEQLALMSNIVTDIGNRLGLEVLYTTHRARVWVIKPMQERVVPHKEEPNAVVQSVLIWKGLLELFQESFPPIILDGVDPEKKITVYPSVTVKDFVSMRQILNMNGLELVEEEREIEALVFNDK